MFPQRRALIITTEKPPSLQLRHQPLRNIIQPLRQERQTHRKAISSLLRQPSPKLIRDRLGRAYKRQARIPAIPLRQLSHTQLLLPRQPNHARLARLARVRLGDIVGQRAVGVEGRSVGAQRDGQGRDGAVVVHLAVENEPLGLRVLDRVADDDERRGQDLQVVAVAAGGRDAALDVGVELLGGLQVSRRAEHHLGCFGGELSAWLRLTGLDDDGPALHWSCYVEGAAHFQLFALVVQDVHLLGVEVDAALLIAGECIIGKAVPQTGHDIVEFSGPFVAFAVFYVLV